MTVTDIPGVDHCAQPISTPPCAAPARSIDDMLGEGMHSADTIAALAAAAELAIYEVERDAPADFALWLDRSLSDAHKLIRLARREALALADVISGVELACRSLALGEAK